MRVPVFFPALGASVLLAVLLASCTKRPGGSSGETLHVAVGHEVQDLDPQIVTGAPERAVLTALFEGLVSEDETGRGTAPGVATHWETSEDGLRWTFHLRADARWSNGAAVTAHDFVRAYERMLSPSLGAEFAYNLFPLEDAENYHAGRTTEFARVGVKALDDRTLLLVLRHRTPFLLDLLKHYSWFPVHVATLEKQGAATRRGTAWTRPENFVGNGAFTLQSWRPHEKIVLVRSPTYWDRDRVKLEQIHFYGSEDLDAQERMFRTGMLHRTSELPLSKIPVYRRTRPDAYRQEPYYGVYFLRLNTTRPPLNDVRVRRALSLAIDRTALVENITRGGQQPAFNYCPPSDKFVSRARVTGDLETARRLLNEAGFHGERARNLVLLYNTSESHRVIAEAIQQMWQRNLGITVALTNQEWKVYLDSFQSMNYDIARGGWIANYPDPHTFFEVWTSGGGNNNTGFGNVDYDRILASALHAATEVERMEAYQKLEHILMREVPVVPIYFYTRVYALAPQVTGWPANLLDARGWKYIGLGN